MQRVSSKNIRKIIDESLSTEHRIIKTLQRCGETPDDIQFLLTNTRKLIQFLDTQKMFLETNGGNDMLLIRIKGLLETIDRSKSLE